MPANGATHYLLVFVDPAVSEFKESQKYMKLMTTLKDWLLRGDSIQNNGQNVLKSKEIFLFSTAYDQGSRALLNYRIQPNEYCKLRGRGYRREKVQKFERLFHKAMNDHSLSFEAKNRKIFQTSFTIQNYLKNLKPEDEASIFYFSDMMQIDPKPYFSKGKFNFIIPNKDLDQAFPLNDENIREIERQLNEDSSPIQNQFVKKVKPEFSKLANQKVRVIVVKDHTQIKGTELYQPSDVMKIWGDYFTQSQLIKDASSFQEYPIGSTWQNALNERP